MKEKRLVRCTQCDRLALFSPFDRVPEYHKTGERWKTLERDDRALFLAAHREHQLEELRIIEDSFISSQPYAEPVKTTYFEATNGKQRFVVRKSRRTISEPQRYELVPGRLDFTATEPHIERASIQRLLQLAFSPTSLSLTKIRDFVSHLELLVSRLDPKGLRRACFESHTPSMRYHYLDLNVVEKAVKNMSVRLSRDERYRLQDFVQKHLEDEVFMIKVRIRFEIVPTTRLSTQKPN
jgi:hypothetical protein